MTDAASFKVLNHDLLLQTPRFDVMRDEIVSADGHPQAMYYVRKRDAVLVVPVYEGRIGVATVTRYIVQTPSLEFIGGRIEDGMTPLQMAQQELEEETNLTAYRWHALSESYPLPSVATERIYTYIANLSSDAGVRLATQEGISRLDFHTPEAVTKLLLAGRFRSSISGYAAFLAIAWLAARKD